MNQLLGGDLLNLLYLSHFIILCMGMQEFQS